jgi:acyl-CoA hydrolase
MTVIVEITTENANQESKNPQVSGRFVMAAVDETGVPISIPSRDNESRNVEVGS